MIVDTKNFLRDSYYIAYIPMFCFGQESRVS